MPHTLELEPLPQEHTHTQLKKNKLETDHKNQNDYIGFSIALDCLPKFKCEPFAEHTSHFRHRIWRNHGRTDLEASTLSISSYRMGRNYSRCQGIKAINSST